MSAPDNLGPLKIRDGEAVFDEAWQAQALGIADMLVKQGVFTASQWAEALGVAVREDGADTTESYYAAVLRAVERLLDDAGAVAQPEIKDRRDAWARAYENTPHGAPVMLEAGETA